MTTYSFLSVQAAITGPGGVIPLGSGSGAAEEGISVEMLEEKDLMTVGADGQIMHSLRASNAAKITVRLLKTSPVNALLQALYNFQRLSPANWGLNTMLVTDVNRGDVCSVSQAAFSRQTPVTYQKDGGTNEWTFYGNYNQLLGAN